MQKYVCKIDNKSFSTQEELTKYMIDKYTMIDAAGGELAMIHQKLQEYFPFAEINVQETTGKRYGKFQVNMIWNDENADFTFFVGGFEEYDYYYNSFENIESAISYYQTFIDRKSEIIEKLNSNYDFDVVKVNQMFEGDSDSNNTISFICLKENEEYFGSYEFGDIDAFVSSFRGFFETIIEGEVVVERNHSSGYDREPTIGGVPLNRLIHRAKKMRIEIIEEK